MKIVLTGDLHGCGAGMDEGEREGGRAMRYVVEVVVRYVVEAPNSYGAQDATIVRVGWDLTERDPGVVVSLNGRPAAKILTEDGEPW